MWPSGTVLFARQLPCKELPRNECMQMPEWMAQATIKDKAYGKDCLGFCSLPVTTLHVDQHAQAYHERLHHDDS